MPPAILDRSVIDTAESVTDDESFAVCRRLIREEGLLVGGSAGAVGLLSKAVRGIQSGYLRYYAALLLIGFSGLGAYFLISA